MNNQKFTSLSNYAEDQYIDFILENINEGMSLKHIKEAISKIKNPKSAIKKLISKFNVSNNTRVKKAIVIWLMLLINISGAQPIFNFEDNAPQLDKVSNSIAEKPEISYQDLKASYMNDVRINMAKKIKSYKTSHEAKELIKKHELLKLVAYKLGDRMVTIGYGHAERTNKTNLIAGKTKITEDQANKIFEKDIKSKEDGVKRMMLEWFRNDGIDPVITQSMFDALVSMAYNMGNYGLSSSPFISGLKKIDMYNKNELLKAAEKIKTTRINPKFKRGLMKRRKDEFNLFIKDTVQA